MLLVVSFVFLVKYLSLVVALLKRDMLCIHGAVYDYLCMHVRVYRLTYTRTQYIHDAIPSVHLLHLCMHSESLMPSK
jgi:hypothetical protein